MTRKRTLTWGALVAALTLLALGFAALGVWQIERRAWKHQLIADVDARIHAPAAAPPGPAAWPQVSAARDAYARVRIAGHYLAGKDTKVRAVSDFGAGYWIMTPFDTGAFTVLVNRGFVGQGAADTPPPADERIVTGLLRITEPGGGFLRTNDPVADKWYSRDVAAIARSRRLSRVAPYFIDADRSPGDKGPVGGLTVVRFNDNHLVYALTWFALAVLSIVGLWRLLKRSEHATDE